MFKRALILGLFFGALIASGEVLDRIVATVNGHVILLSDLDDELRFESLTSGAPLKNTTPEQKKAALDRLIDQELLREQTPTAALKPIPPEQVTKQLEQIKQSYSNDHPGGSWDDAVLQLQLGEKFLERHVRAELEQLEFVDARFRSSVQVSPEEIGDYYRKELVPNLPPSDPVSLSEATPKIREILVQRKMNEMLNSWLDVLHSQAQIRIFTPEENSSPAQVGPQ